MKTETRRIDGKVRRVIELAGNMENNIYLNQKGKTQLQEIDAIYGTHMANQQQENVAISALNAQYQRDGDLNKYAAGLQNIKDKFSTDDQGIIKAQQDVAKLQQLIDALHGRNINININGGGGGQGCGRVQRDREQRVWEP